jgi:hypothetical protein
MYAQKSSIDSKLASGLSASPQFSLDAFLGGLSNHSVHLDPHSAVRDEKEREREKEKR